MNNYGRSGQSFSTPMGMSFNQAPGIDVLREASGPGAALDSSERYDR